MTNEELALSIQAGDAAQCGPLWEQVKGIVIARARGYAAGYGDLCAACGGHGGGPGAKRVSGHAGRSGGL